MQKSVGGFPSACGVFLSLKAVVQAQNAVPRSTLCETGASDYLVGEGAKSRLPQWK